MKIPKNVCNLSRKKLDKIYDKVYKLHDNKTKKYNITKNKTRKYIKELIQTQDKTSSVIPLNIYQVWHDKNELPSSVKESVELIKEQNPEFNHYLFDEKECRQFIKENYSKRFVDAYDKIIPHAIKADLWRYCYIYKKGGIYLDSKYYCINGFKLILLTDKEYFCRDIDTSLSGIYNAILVCKPKNKILLKSMNKMIENVENNYYGNTGLCPTGPLMMKQFFTEKEINNLDLTHEYINKSNRFINLNHHRVLKYNENYAKEKAQNGNHWDKYWQNKQLYK
jgi:mannosyltransferase OCH1-like enzyme